jgi:hypothetical protein
VFSVNLPSIVFLVPECRYTIPALKPMRKRFILYKIIQIPAGGETIAYLKEIKYGKAYFSSLKSEARRLSLLKALYLGMRYSLSTLPERLA